MYEIMQGKIVTFSDATECKSVTPYSEIYGVHPCLLKSTKDGMQHVTSNADPYTSKSGEIMRARTQRQQTTTDSAKAADAHSHRMKLIAAQKIPPHPRPHSEASISALTLEDQRDAELRRLTQVHPRLAETLQRLCAVRTPPAHKPGGPGAKRQGAKAVKKMERLSTDAYVLPPADATMFRQLSARTNFLSQDRANINFSTKELCRELCQPNQKSYARLKRVVRYLVGLPRLVYQYQFIEKGCPAPDSIDLYVDTDFAGCKETRRSTSGGVAMVGTGCIKHYSKTQTTIALSSGEAELSGIGAGIAQGLGIQSICRDLGYTYKLRVHTDATAAIGIARRRGMGKIRHLDTTDLWVQEVVRSGRVELLKVAGEENMADIMTKYVDRQLLDKMLAKMGMVKASGRPKSAPAFTSSLNSCRCQVRDIGPQFM